MLRMQAYPLEGTFTITVIRQGGKERTYETRKLEYSDRADSTSSKPWGGWKFKIMRKIDVPSKIRLDTHPECFPLNKLEGNLNVVVLKTGACLPARLASASETEFPMFAPAHSSSS